MATDVISKVGDTNSPVTMDYSTLQAWEDACPADLVTADQVWIAECYDQGELTSAASNLLTIAGITADDDCYLIIRCATGASFRDKAGVRTNPLFYDASAGVAIRKTSNYGYGINATIYKLVLQGLQIQTLGTNSQPIQAGNAFTQAIALIDGCIFHGQFGIAVADSTCEAIITNCIALFTLSNYGFWVGGRSSTAGYSQLHGCTSIKLGSAGGTSFLLDNYGSTMIRNCAGFGASSFKTGNSSPISGSGFNATDQASAYGSSNQTSLTFADQFEDSTNDFRAVSTGSLKNGTPDATNLPVDISNTARDATTPYIGVWEVVAAGGGSFVEETKFYTVFSEALIRSIGRRL